jgi:hypothetical protein
VHPIKASSHPRHMPCKKMLLGTKAEAPHRTLYLMKDWIFVDEVDDGDHGTVEGQASTL